MFDELIKWSKKNFSKKLPWRKNRTLYTTLVSEIMLQQTTVPTVLKHYDRFLERFPNLDTLANATEEEVLLEWKGLGYYRRARNLHKISIEVKTRFKGVIPKNEHDLLSLKGVGPYTANALLAIGANQKALAIDGNLERVLSRYLAISLPKGKKLHQSILKTFEEKKLFQSTKDFRGLNEALMDLGREICKPTIANCEICPLKKTCLGEKLKPLKFPIAEKEKKQKYFELHLLRVVYKSGENLALIKRKKGEWLEGQWELPTYVLKTEDSNFTQYPLLKKEIDIADLKFFRSAITNYKIINYVIMTDKKNQVSEYLDFKSISLLKRNEKLHLTTATIKTLDKLNL